MDEQILADIEKHVKRMKEYILTRFIVELAADREFITEWLQSLDISIDTGDIPPTNSINITMAVPFDKAITCEKISWKLTEWWQLNIEWIRDGVTVFSEDDAVDWETPARLVPVYDSSILKLTNTSTTTSVRAKIRWHYALSDRRIYNSFLTGILSNAGEDVREVAGMPKEG